MFDLETISAMNNQAMENAKRSVREAKQELRRKPFVYKGALLLNGRRVTGKHQTIFQTAQDGFVTV